MARPNERQAGVFSGVLAAIMIVALSAMAFTSLAPARETPLRVANFSIPLPEIMPETIPNGG